MPSYPCRMSSGSHIKVLPTHVANKIAAGEVVERPASVVKELIENALDAGATRVDVEVSAGGRKWVSVSDNGTGMGRDDALLSVERQATSKISDVDDIERIATLGFRGEALAAIASASRFRLATSRVGDLSGTEISVIGGKLQDVREIGCPAGTTVDVRDLFFNIPARRKFLRTYQTEQARIRACFIQQSLAHPAVGMCLKVDGREVYGLAPDAGFKERLRELFGPDCLRGLRPVEYTVRGVAVRGHISMPTISRGDRNEQYVFVNGRVTSAPLINFAVREGYRGLLPKDRYPTVFLFVDLDPALVDVNVHPAKREVRFRRPSAVRDTLISAIQKALAVDGAPLPPLGDEAPLPSLGKPFARPSAEVQMRIDNLPTAPAFPYPRMRGPEREIESQPADSRNEPPSPDAPIPTPQSPIPHAPWSWCRVVGLIGNYYVVLETEDGMVMMDPRSAHERVLYEQFMKGVKEGNVPSQSMLMPQTVELKPRDAANVRKHVKLLKKLGFGLSEFGGDSFVVDALPAPFSGASAASILIELCAEMEQAGARGGKGRMLEETVAQAASRAAVRARDRLTLEEIENLVIELARTEMPYTCPHGRPTVIFTALGELNKKFGRR